MKLKLADEQFLEFLEQIKPKIKKELYQVPPSDRDDLEQEMILHIYTVSKTKEFEGLDFFNMIA